MKNLSSLKLIIGIILVSGLSISGSLLLGNILSGDLNVGARTSNFWKTVSGKLQTVNDRAVKITGDLEFMDEIKPDGATCSNGQILKKTGADDWDCAADDGGTSGGGTGGGGSTDMLSQIGDVSTSTLADGYVIEWYAASSLWVSTTTSVNYFYYETATSTASQTVFNIAGFTYTVGDNQLDVYVNGIYQLIYDAYNETDNNTITFNAGLNENDRVAMVIRGGSTAAAGSQLTEEEVEDYVGGMVTGNTETNITVTYQDADGTIDFEISDFLAASLFYATTTIANLSITESQVSDLGTYTTYPAVYNILAATTTLLNLSITESQVSDLGSYLTAVASDATWTTHDSYPANCASQSVAIGFGDTMTCTATTSWDTTVDGQTDVLNDTEIEDIYLHDGASDTMTGTLTADGLTLGENENLTLGSQTLDHDGTDFVFNDSMSITGNSTTTGISVFTDGTNGLRIIPGASTTLRFF